MSGLHLSSVMEILDGPFLPVPLVPLRGTNDIWVEEVVIRVQTHLFRSGVRTGAFLPNHSPIRPEASHGHLLVPSLVFPFHMDQRRELVGVLAHEFELCF